MLRENEKWHQLSLRLFGDLLPVSTISAALRLPAKYIGIKDEPRQGNPKYARHETNIWTHSSTDDARTPFEVQLEQLVAHLETVAEPLRNFLSIPGVEADLFLGFSSGSGQGGFSITPSLLQRIARLRIELTVDLYPPTIDDEDPLSGENAAT